MKPLQLNTSVLKAVFAVCALGIANTPTSVQAAIKCEGEYQIINGNGLKSTPFCQAEYLSYLARSSYGIKVSASTLRNNINRVIYLCRIIGHDHRLNSICGGYQNPNGRGRLKS